MCPDAGEELVRCGPAVRFYTATTVARTGSARVLPVDPAPSQAWECDALCYQDPAAVACIWLELYPNNDKTRIAKCTVATEASGGLASAVGGITTLFVQRCDAGPGALARLCHSYAKGFSKTRLI